MPERPSDFAHATVIRERYRVDRVLGRGGLSTVYLGRDLRKDRNVAIKVLDGLDDRMQAVMLRESRLLRSLDALNDPGIASVLDLVVEEDRLILIQTYVEGISLRRWQKDRVAHEVIFAYHRIAVSLHGVHSLHVVHRDLKPENIIVRINQPVIIDFGLAVRSTEPDQLTRTGMMVGTPAYLSPESIRGDEVGVESDIFSLGVMLFEAVAGEPPWHSDSITQALISRLQSPPDFDKLGPLQSRLEPVIAEMLAVEPGKRPTAQSVATSLGMVALAARHDESDVPSYVRLPLTEPVLPSTTTDPGTYPDDHVRVSTQLARTPVPIPTLSPRPSVPWSAPSRFLAVLGVTVLAAIAALYFLATDVRVAIVGLWVGVVATGVWLVRRWSRDQRSKDVEARELAASAGVIERIAAIEQSVKRNSEITETLALRINDIGGRMQPEQLGNLIRDTMVVALKGLGAQPVPQTATLDRALEIIADLSKAKQDKKKGLLEGLSANFGAISGIVTVLGGAIGLLATMNVWRPNASPVISALKLDRDRIATGNRYMLSTAAKDPEGRNMTYTYTASTGTIEGSGPSVSWTPPNPLTQKVVTFTVVVSDGAQSVTEQTSVRVNNRPRGDLQVPDAVNRNSSIQLIGAVEDPDGDALTFNWTASLGARPSAGRVAVWQTPAGPGPVRITCEVSDGFELLLLEKTVRVK